MEDYHTPYPVKGSFPPIDESNIGKLQVVLQDDEIKAAIFSMHPFKAPGVDGLHAVFYQSQWDTVGESVCNLVRQCFHSNNIPTEINRTLIVLIPKVDQPINIRMYRPISLCPIIYKTITKIVANRLKAILSNLIGPTQTSFVPGRHITENIVVAQEIIHSMRRKKGKRGQMLIKVDLEKAYDRLSRDFIHETLREAGIPSELIHLIMNCISSVTMQVLWNGECTDYFSTSRGIRQGDPITPYVFVLCIERLSHGINRAVQSGKWTPIRLSRRGTPITHLFFADDLLLLAEASCEQAHMIQEVLNTFCASSGEKVNNTKTQVFFSKNVRPPEIKGISLYFVENEL